MSRAVVIGAGAIGLLAAYELRRRGIESIVVDKGQPGAGCSSGNTGGVVPSFSGPLPAPGAVRTSLRWMLSSASPLYIKPRLNLALARWLWGSGVTATIETTMPVWMRSPGSAGAP